MLKQCGVANSASCDGIQFPSAMIASIYARKSTREGT
jgi:hypothetical protein